MFETESLQKAIHEQSNNLFLHYTTLKLFLTSAGITTEQLKQEFCSMLPCSVAEAKLVFIPTGANVYKDIWWLEEDYKNVQRCGFGETATLDIATASPKRCLEACLRSDVIWFNGGNTYYLLDWMRRSGLAAVLPMLLADRVYAGCSAGSMVMGPSVEHNAQFFPEENSNVIEDLTGLGFVDFAFIPHLNAKSFSECNAENVQRFAAGTKYPVYAVDNNSAIKVVGGQTTIVGNGTVLQYSAGAGL